MSENVFTISRTNGKSNAQVILDYVNGDEPGTTYPFKAFIDELHRGTDHEYSISDVRRIVAALYSRLLKEQSRALHSVRSVGYRLAMAADHGWLAVSRKRRADVQMLRGVQTLQHVRWGELGEQERKAHEGTMMVMSALWEAQRLLERRQNAVEGAVRSLVGGQKNG